MREQLNLFESKQILIIIVLHPLEKFGANVVQLILEGSANRSWSIFTRFKIVLIYCILKQKPNTWMEVLQAISCGAVDFWNGAYIHSSSVTAINSRNVDPKPTSCLSLSFAIGLHPWNYLMHQSNGPNFVCIAIRMKSSTVVTCMISIQK